MTIPRQGHWHGIYYHRQHPQPPSRAWKKQDRNSWKRLLAAARIEDSEPYCAKLFTYPTDPTRQMSDWQDFVAEEGPAPTPAQARRYILEKFPELYRWVRLREEDIAQPTMARQPGIGPWPGPMTVIPNMLLDINRYIEERLGSTEMVVLLNIIMEWPDDGGWPVLAKSIIAKRTGLSPRQVQRAVTVLEDRGLLERGRKHGAVNSYDLSKLVTLLAERSKSVTNDRPAEMTYAELAEAKGITPDSAKRLAKRKNWPKRLRNGVTRVTVPPDAAVRSEPTTRRSGRPRKNMTIDADLIALLNDKAGVLEASFGFRPTLSQTLRHLLLKIKETGP